MFNSKAIRFTTLSLLAVAATAAHAELIYGVSTTGLYSFDSAAPASFTTVGTLSGVTTGQTLRAIDFRPSSGTLYAISSSTTTGLAQLYTVNLSTAALTAVGSSFALATTSTRVSMDFNPVVDRIRVVTGNGATGTDLGLNLRLNPDTGAIAATDTALAYDPTDTYAATTPTPLVGDVAYSNNVAGATATTLYAYEFTNDSLNTIGTVNGAQSPNTGVLHSIGVAGGTTSAFNAAIGFDISGATGTGYISYDNGPSALSNAELFSVNLGTGTLTQIGADDALPSGLLDLSVRIAPVPEPTTVAALGLAALAIVRRRRRNA